MRDDEPRPLEGLPTDATTARVGAAVVLDGADLGSLLSALERAGYAEVIAPTVRDGAIVPAAITSVQELPTGVGDAQAPGSYRLTRSDDGAWFAHAVGPQPWKTWFRPSEELLFRTRPTGAAELGFAIDEAPIEAPARALLGLKPCDVAALAALDHVVGKHDARYAARRAPALVIATSCTAPAATCFCTSMGTGPAAHQGHDIAITELVAALRRERGAATTGDGEARRSPDATSDEVTGDRAPGEHRLVLVAATERGRAVLDHLERARPATERDLADARRATDDAAARIERSLDHAAAHDALGRPEPVAAFAEVAARCMACGNCTMVCPTCFCVTIDEATDLVAGTEERWMRADSCFTGDFSYLHGGSVRGSTASRYRQWISHKLATFEEQLGAPGCVGCGRCTTWCPVGIDLVAEARAAIARRRPTDPTGPDPGGWADAATEPQP